MLQRYDFFRRYTNIDLKKFYMGLYVCNMEVSIIIFFCIFLWKNLEIQGFIIIFVITFKSKSKEPRAKT